MFEDSDISNSAYKFVTATLQQSIRLDGRKPNEFRPLNVTFGHDWGCAYVALGETKVLAQVSCEIGIPKSTRPNEGTLYTNIELAEISGLDADNLENKLVLLNRYIERTFRESKCVDLESLCIKSDEHVWVLRVDITVLNYEGNLNDACSIAALASLMHFRRPDISVVDKSYIVHRPDEKEYIPIVLHHFPMTITYCLCNDGNTCVVDPSELEEAVAESQLVYGFNSYQELCTLNLGGSTLTNTLAIIQNAKLAANRAKYVVDQLHETLSQHLMQREANQPYGFHTMISAAEHITAQHFKLKLRLYDNEELQNIEREETKIEILKKPQLRNTQQDPSNMDIADSTSFEEQNADAYDNAWLPVSGDESDGDNADVNMLDSSFNDDSDDTDKS